MNNRFIDIHCHPSLYPFNRMRNTEKEKSQEFNLWHSDPPNKWEKGKIVRYSQSDFPALIQGGVKVIFASLTPLEREFFIGRREENKTKSIRKKLNGVLSKMIYDKSPIRVVGGSIVSSFPIRRINFLQSEDYDYFDELERNYDFYIKDNNKIFDFKPFDKKLSSNQSVIKGKFVLTENFSDVEGVLSQQDNEVKQIAVVLSIEGGHVFSREPGGRDASIDVILQRIDHIKNNWKYPVLFVSLAHHFYNSLCGHARSFPDNLRWIGNQEIGMNEGITKAGIAAIKRLLSIDDSNGRRILIDVKHMSAKARKQYYYDIVIPYNETNPERKIPVIASHVAYSGIKSLNKLMKIAKFEKHDRLKVKDNLNPTSLNLCDEEVRIIAESNGLIGIIFSERVLVSMRRLKQIKDRRDPDYWARIIVDQIIGFVRAIQVDKNSQKEKQKAWDCVALGTDFDGFCNPPDTFYSAATMPLLAQILIKDIKAYQGIKSLLCGLDVEEIVDKIMFRNALEFLERSY